jgi:hypothetical protein
MLVRVRKEVQEVPWALANQIAASFETCSTEY